MTEANRLLLTSRLTSVAAPTAAGCARLFAHYTLRHLGLPELTDTAGLEPAYRSILNWQPAV